MLAIQVVSAVILAVGGLELPLMGFNGLFASVLGFPVWGTMLVRGFFALHLLK